MEDINNIIVAGARSHNLKNVSIELPKNKFIVFTGVSGSGKSSLVMDTIFAEGQRKYAESLNSYARQFLMRAQKPEVDYIKNLSPAIAIDQKNNNTSPRSTVGTLTEIYEYIKLMFARIGEIYSPVTNEKILIHNSKTIKDYILSLTPNTKVFLAYKIYIKRDTKIISDILNSLIQKGFARVWLNNTVALIEDLLLSEEDIEILDDHLTVIVDRIVIKKFSDEELTRIADSIEIALFEGKSEMFVIINDNEIITFSNSLQIDGIDFLEPSLDLFSFNNSYGACAECKGNGFAFNLDENLIIPDRNLSIYDGAVAPWRTGEMSFYNDLLVKNGGSSGVPIFKPIKNFSKQEYDLIWRGGSGFVGIVDFFKKLESQYYKIQYRVLMNRYKNKTICHECKGVRLRKEALYVRVDNHTIKDIVEMPINRLYSFFQNISLEEEKKSIAKVILLEILNRLRVLNSLCLGHLSLNRPSNTLSGGESQRIKLTLCLGSTLTDSIYILDEPSIGLHSRDTENLIKVLKELKDLENTIIVVEHDETIIKAADHIVDMGPEASYKGGEVVVQSDFNLLKKNSNSLTAKYLNKELIISRDKISLKNNFIELKKVCFHNLKNIDVKIPLECLCVIAGVSGSGKTSLVKNVLIPSVENYLSNDQGRMNFLENIKFNTSVFNKVEMIDQNAIGRSSRSNPISYVGGFDEIRKLFASQDKSLARGYTSSIFSFNTPGGRCEECEGEGEITIEMQFLADIKLKCESCNGTRYKKSVLEVFYRDKNIYDVLNMSVDEAYLFFEDKKNILPFLKSLQDVGLGYINLGQSSSTLSGGEAQRIKIATFLLKGKSSDRTLFVFDEPTTGLHFHDIQKLLNAFQALLIKNNSIVVVEHNLEVIRNADWIIELGPEAGENGGKIIFEGSPVDLKKSKVSFTAPYL